MKRMMVAALMAACLAVVSACITVNNNVGDSAIAATSAAGSAGLDSTNAVSSVQGTNSVSTSTGLRMRGGLIISTSVNKNVSPATSTALQYIP